LFTSGGLGLAILVLVLAIWSCLHHWKAQSFWCAMVYKARYYPSAAVQQLRLGLSVGVPSKTDRDLQGGSEELNNPYAAVAKIPFKIFLNAHRNLDHHLNLITPPPPKKNQNSCTYY